MVLRGIGQVQNVLVTSQHNKIWLDFVQCVLEPIARVLVGTLHLALCSLRSRHICSDRISHDSSALNDQATDPGMLLVLSKSADRRLA